MNEDLIEISTEELRAELERRDRINSLPWPRTINLKGYVEIENIVEVSEKLTVDHGIKEDSPEYQKIYTFLSGIDFEVEFMKNGECDLIAVGGRKLEK